MNTKYGSHSKLDKLTFGAAAVSVVITAASAYVAILSQIDARNSAKQASRANAMAYVDGHVNLCMALAQHYYEFAKSSSGKTSKAYTISGEDYIGLARRLSQCAEKRAAAGMRDCVQELEKNRKQVSC